MIEPVNHALRSLITRIIPSVGIGYAEATLDLVPAAIIVTNASFAEGGPLVRYVNPAFEQMTGWSRAEIYGKSPRILQGPRTSASVIDGLRAALRAGETWSGTTWNYRRNGEPFLMTWIMRPFGEGSTAGWMAIQLELPPMLASSAVFEHEPLVELGIDAASGLLTHQALWNRLRDRLDHTRGDAQITLAYVDIDRYLAITALLDEAALVALSMAIAARLHETPGMRATAAGEGGHYFVLFDDPEAARRLPLVFEHPFLIGSRRLHLTATIGIAVSPKAGTTATSLFRSAQIAAKRGKEHGRGHIVWHERGMTLGLRARRELETAMGRGLTEDLFAVQLQPKLDLAVGRVSGVEALARWRDPDLGVVPPSEFIPVAEEAELIVPLGRALLEKSFRAMALSDAAGNALTLAVNVGPKQLTHGAVGDYTRTLVCLARENNFPVYRLEVEITESVIADARVYSEVACLREEGVKITIDDFGKEYSNLAQVAAFDAHSLKIDKSLIDHCLTNVRTGEIIRTIVDLAKRLSMQTVAEGVEDVEQLVWLGSIGCTAAQGYTVSPPLEPLDLVDFISRLHPVPA